MVASKKEKVDLRKEKKKKYLFAYRILKEPHITEKSTMLNERNEYVFKVYPKANKAEIKKAIESLYNIDVLDVRVINVHQKSRRLGRTTGFRKGYKKAIVKIKEGQKIEILPR
ncbi:50S ribosomal protein L23 [bacterium]|nr:50S ribosomal protein L23 [bacterium]